MAGSRSDRVKPKTIKFVFAASAKHTVLSNKAKTGWPRASIMHLSEATCLLADWFR